MPLSTSQYRQISVGKHNAEARSRYVRDLRRLHGAKMKKGLVILVNHYGKNKKAIIQEDLKPTSTSLKVKMIDSQKIMRKDLATIYGFPNEKPEEADPSKKLIQISKQNRALTPKKLLLEAKTRPRARTPPTTQRKKISEGMPYKKK